MKKYGNIVEPTFIDTIECPKCNHVQDSEIDFVKGENDIPFPVYFTHCKRCDHVITSKDWNAKSIKMIEEGEVKIEEVLVESFPKWAILSGAVIGIIISYLIIS